MVAKHVGHILFENAISTRGKEEWGYQTQADYAEALKNYRPWSNTRVTERPCNCQS